MMRPRLAIAKYSAAPFGHFAGSRTGASSRCKIAMRNADQRPNRFVEGDQLGRWGIPRAQAIMAEQDPADAAGAQAGAPTGSGSRWAANDRRGGGTDMVGTEVALARGGIG